MPPSTDRFRQGYDTHVLETLLSFLKVARRRRCWICGATGWDGGDGAARSASTGKLDMTALLLDGRLRVWRTCGDGGAAAASTETLRTSGGGSLQISHDKAGPTDLGGGDDESGSEGGHGRVVRRNR
ncbi:hypothetical protein Drorol1_Dr00020831 [Drosera rotundifolia]